MKHKHCEWCDNQFAPRVSYQIYCSSECRELATREKITERYSVTRRAKMASRVRLCKSCNTRLSAYNDEDLCQKCLINPKDVKKALKDIRGIINEKDS
jgi:predicted nucleic acid-binding Zn ribbon protein